MKVLTFALYTVFWLALIALLFIGSDKQFRENCERAYFEGQKDAINGDIRIIKTPENRYIWSKTPWDSGKLPIYYPSLEESKP